MAWRAQRMSAMGGRKRVQRDAGALAGWGALAGNAGACATGLGGGLVGGSGSVADMTAEEASTKPATRR